MNYGSFNERKKFAFFVGVFCQTQALKERKETVDCDDRAVISHPNGTWCITIAIVPLVRLLECQWDNNNICLFEKFSLATRDKCFLFSFSMKMVSCNSTIHLMIYSIQFSQRKNAWTTQLMRMCSPENSDVYPGQLECFISASIDKRNTRVAIRQM